MALRQRAWFLCAGLLLPATLLAQKPTREEIVQQALNKQTIVAVERQGALILRDLAKHCGADAATTARLGEALNKAIAQWVEAHPPQVYGTYQPDWGGIQKLPVWAEAVATAMPPEVRRAWQALEAGRQQRLAASTARFVRALVACELRLTPDQIEALEPLCQRIAGQSTELAVRARPGQLVRELDRNGGHVLTAVQTEYQDQANSYSPRRDANSEFLLESERIRLLCKLDDDRARLLRACGQSQGWKQIAEARAKAKAEAEAKAKADAAAKAEAEAKAKVEAAAKPVAADQALALVQVAAPGEPAPAAVVKAQAAAVAKTPARVSNGLPDDSCLADAFWIKVRDTLLTPAERQLLAATPAPGQAEVVAARVEFLVASLDSMFHLDPEQVKAVTPLAQRVVEHDLTSGRISWMDVTRGFGLNASRQETTPEQRGAMKGLEDLLDRPQFEVLRDKVGI